MESMENIEHIEHIEHIEELRSSAVVYSFMAELLQTPVPVPGHDYVIKIINSFEVYLSSPGVENLASYAMLVEARNAIEGNAEAEQVVLATERTKYVRGLQTDNPVRPPFEALYTTQSDSPDAIADVAGAYRHAGFALHADAGNRPDSLEIECRFLAQVLEEEAGALEGGDGNRYRELDAIRRAFFENHIANWVPQFCDAVIAHAQSRVLKGILLFLKEFIESETTQESRV